jgi:sulfatase modifying factor 1
MKLIINFFLLFFLSTNLFAFDNPKINLGKFSLNKYEITIKEFEDYANQKNFKTLAEKKGGGFEWGAGWERRSGWTYKTLLEKNLKAF